MRAATLLLSLNTNELCLADSAPLDPAKLKQEATLATRAGRFAEAEERLQQVLALRPGDVPTWLNLAAVRRSLGKHEATLAAIDSALSIEPRNFFGLMARGLILEKLDRHGEALSALSAAVIQAPPEHQLDAATRNALLRARAMNKQYVRELDGHIQKAVESCTSEFTAGEARRAASFVELLLRKRPRYRQEPVDFYYPELPAVEFYDRATFPWLAEFEAATPQILEELRLVLAEDRAKLTPYIDYPRHLPVDQWRELNQSMRWSAFHFSLYGKPYPENMARCPKTVEAISRLPQPVLPNRTPAAMFSVLQPRTRIPPHHGVANIRLVTHLPLIIPPRCGFRVGGETREWRVGEAWVFDDTIEHEAWNDSDEERIVLICDVWSPLLSEAERILIASVLQAMDDFGAEQFSWKL